MIALNNLFVTPQRTATVLGIMLLVGLFLPATLFFYGVLTIVVVGIVGLWIFTLYRCLIKSVLCFLLILIASLPVGYFGWLPISILLIPIPFLVAMLWPTAINVMTTYFIVSHLPISGLPKVLGFLGISLLLGLNMILPVSIYDAFTQASSVNQISPSLSLPSNDFLSIETNAQTIAIGSDELLNVGFSTANGGYWQTPRLTEFGVAQALEQEGVRYKIEKTSTGKHRLVVSAENQGLVTQVNFSLYQDEEKVSDYQQHFRNHYPFEPWLGNGRTENSRDLDNLEMRAYYLAQSNLWNLLVSIPGRIQNKRASPLARFLQHAVSKEIETTSYVTLQSALVDIESPSNKLNKGHSPAVTSMCVAEYETPNTYKYSIKPGYHLKIQRPSNMVFEHEGVVINASPKWLEFSSVGKVVCTDTTYLAVLYSENNSVIDNGFFFVQEYSLEGTLLATYKILFPKITNSGPMNYVASINWLAYNESGLEFDLTTGMNLGERHHHLVVQKTK